MNYRVWGIPAVLSTGIPGNALRAFPEEIPEFLPESANPYWGCGSNAHLHEIMVATPPPSQSGKLFYLQLELFCLQLSFFAYSPLRPLLDALCHCKQKSFNCEQKTKIVSKKAAIVSKELKVSTVSKKLHCKQEASNCKQKSRILFQNLLLDLGHSEIIGVFLRYAGLLRD